MFASGQPSLLMASMLTRSSAPRSFTAALTVCPMRSFAYSSRYVGPNDMIRQEQAEKRKYGMRRHFYDKENHPDMEDPDKQ